MKLSSLYVITIVLLLFLTIQGWVINQKFWSPKRVDVAEAVLMGVSADVKAPLPAQVVSIAVQENERVEIGQTLFTIRPQGQGTVRIASPRDGILTNVLLTPGVFVQVNEKLAEVVDGSPEALHVRARLLVKPENVKYIKPRLLATVHADYLNDGNPLKAMVTAVSPQYDAEAQTIDVRLKLLDMPKGFSLTALGLPVELEFGQQRSLLERLRSIAGVESSTASGGTVVE